MTALNNFTRHAFSVSTPSNRNKAPAHISSINSVSV